MGEVRGCPNRRRSGGFFRPQPWLQSARDLPHPTVGVLTAVVVAVVGIWTAVSLFLASGQPTLPSSHAVLVSFSPSSGRVARGSGHLIWYRSGGLLVVAVGLEDLAPRAKITAWLVHRSSCTGTRPSGATLVGSARASASGLAHLNQEVLGVSNLTFAAWSIWVESGKPGRTPAACTVISLAGGGLNSS
ncbi:MAG: hypothetical protein WBA31_00560 [Candidatus Dormiibacterota bacterium]